MKRGWKGYKFPVAENLKTADADDIIQAVYDVSEGKSVLDPTIAHKLMTELAGQPATNHSNHWPRAGWTCSNWPGRGRPLSP